MRVEAQLPVTGARETHFLAVDDRTPDGGLELAVLFPDILVHAHLVHDRLREAQIALGGDLDIEALEPRAAVDDVPEEFVGALPVAGNLDPDEQVDVTGLGGSTVIFEDGAFESGVSVEGAQLVVAEVDLRHHDVALPVDGSRGSRGENLVRCTTVGPQDGGVDGSAISAGGGRAFGNRCSESRVGTGQVAAENFSALDVNVGEGVSPASVADNTSVRHGCVGESSSSCGGGGDGV